MDACPGGWCVDGPCIQVIMNDPLVTSLLSVLQERMTGIVLENGIVVSKIATSLSISQ